MKVTRLIVCSVAVALASVTAYAVPLVANQDHCRAFFCSGPGWSSECLMQGYNCGYCAPDNTCRYVYPGP